MIARTEANSIFNLWSFNEGYLLLVGSNSGTSFGRTIAFTRECTRWLFDRKKCRGVNNFLVAPLRYSYCQFLCSFSGFVINQRIYLFTGLDGRDGNAGAVFRVAPSGEVARGVAPEKRLGQVEIVQRAFRHADWAWPVVSCRKRDGTFQFDQCNVIQPA